MRTNRLQLWLARAAEELGIRIIVGYVARLPDGATVPTQALLPDLGGALGTLVFASSDALEASIRSALVKQGFSVSTFSEPAPNEEFDLDGYAEMFSEWGWTSDGKPKPPWME
jgi:hypothetical protein